MGIFDFERLFDLNNDGHLDSLERGLEFTVIDDILNDDEGNDDLFSSDSDDEFDTDFGDELWFSFSKQSGWQQKSEMIFRLEIISLIFLVEVILPRHYSL